MLHRLLTELRRLRWKLALAYTVTTASVLTVLFVLLALAAFQASGSREQQGRYIRQVLRQVAARAAPFLAVEPVDGEGLSVLLTVALERSGIGQIVPLAQLDLTSVSDAAPIDLSLSANAYLMVLDRDNRLVASTQPAAGASIGQPFDTAALPGLAGLLAGDLSKENLIFDEPAGRALVVAPIAGSQRLGTLVYAASDIPSRPLEVTQIITSLGGVIAWFTVAAATVGMAFGLITAHGLTRRLRAIERATAAWGGGDFAPRLADGSADEIGQLSRQLNGVADQIALLIEERQQFASLDERNRLARDLHDSVKQHVFAASMNLGAAQELWPEDAAAAAALSQRAAAATAQAQRELNDIILALRPLALERAGLAQALADVAAGWSAQSGIPVSCDILFVGSLAPPVEQALFRVAQEALANVSRHSGARSATLALRESEGELLLCVSDDGRGFDAGSARAGMGLRSMRERAAAIGARLEIRSDGQGTELRVTLPLR